MEESKKEQEAIEMELQRQLDETNELLRTHLEEMTSSGKALKKKKILCQRLRRRRYSS